MVLWIINWRVMLVLALVSLAIVVAGFLIFIELRAERQKKREDERVRDYAPIEKMKVVLARVGDAKSKADFVGKTAKDYFAKEYGMSNNLGYSDLIKKFEKSGRELELEFCRGMFELYYSDKGLDEEDVGKMADVLIDIFRKKKIDKVISSSPSFWDKVDRFFDGVHNSVTGKIHRYFYSKHKKKQRKKRIIERERHELSKWVKRAIHLGYEKKKIFSFLKKRWMKKEAKKILKFYNKEISRKAHVKKRRPIIIPDDKEEGVAQRIVEEEKERISKEENLVI